MADLRNEPYVEQLVRETMSMSTKFVENAIYLMDNVERWGAGVEYHFQELNEPYAPS